MGHAVLEEAFRSAPAAADPSTVFRPPSRHDARRYDVIDSPIGELLLTSDGEALTGLFMMPGARGAPDLADEGWSRDPGALGEATGQLAAYFAGELTAFDLPLAPRGTPFQRAVWAALTTITYGSVTSYAAVAGAVGRPAAVRAVGAANGRNPIAVIIPCHRVVGSDGSLTGYGGGLDRKRRLLSLESAAQRQGRQADSRIF